MMDDEKSVIQLRKELEEAKVTIAALEARLADTPLQDEILYKSHLLDLIMENTTDNISLVRPDRTYIAMSRAYEKVLDIPPGWAIGKSAQEVLGPSFFEKIRFIAAQSLQKKTMHHHGWYHYPGAGKRFMDITYAPMQNDKGEVIALLNIARDITDQKQLDIAIQEERDRLDNILASLQSGLCVVNPDMTIAWHNRHLSNIVPHKNPVGMDFHSFLHASNTSCNTCVVRETFASGQSQYKEYSIEGRGRWFAIFTQPLESREDNIEGVLCSITDITERKLGEIELQESQKRINLALQANKAVIWDIDFKTNKLQFSPDRLGPDASIGIKAIQTAEIWHEHIHPADRPWVLEALQRFRDKGCEESLNLEYRFLNHRNEWIWLRSTGNIVEWDSEGIPSRMVGISNDVSAERYMQEQLNQVEQNYQEIFNTTTDAILLLDEETFQIVDANTAAQELFGYTHEEMLRLDIKDLSHGEYPFSLDEARQVALAYDGPQSLEWYHRRQDGKRFWAEVRLKKATIGGKRRFISSMRDITSRLQTSRALEERERTLRSILEAAPLLICLITPENLVWSNSQVTAILGYSIEEAEGAYLSMFFPEDTDFSLIRDDVLDQLRTQGRAILETDLRHKQNFLVQTVIRLAPIDPLRPENASICIVTDVSYRKQWERMLMEREARYRDIFDNAPVGILRTDFDGYPLHFNQAFAQMLGYESVAQASQEIGENILHLYQDASRREVLKEQLLKHGAVNDFEIACIDRNGGHKILQMNLRYIDVGGRKLIDGFATDITDKRRIEQETKERDKQLIQADKLISLGILSSGVAHEINNPNNFIAINAPLLQQAWQSLLPLLDAHAEEAGDFMVGELPYSRLKMHLPRLLDGIISGSQRIQQIVDNMRRLANPDMETMAEEVDLNRSLKIAIPFVKARIAKFRCQLELELDENQPFANGSPRQIEQVILNLMLNALDAMAETGGKLIVRTGHDAAAGTAWLSVTDCGKGIDPVAANQLFTPFFTTKRAMGGTGLGLAISQKIMQLHGGSVTLSNNTPGPGATATMTLPMANHSNENTK